MNSPTLTQETILIVDDMPDNLRLLSTMLASKGYQVKKAINGRFALQGMEVVRPDLILLDINMPEMNGYQVCETLKTDDKTASIPIIFISGYNEVLDRIRAFQVGGSDYITKPFHVEEVLVRVDNQLNQRRLLQELQQKNELLQQEIQERQRLEAEVIELQRELERLTLDPLTQVANRRKFEDFLRQQWESLYQDQLPLSVIMLDVDEFFGYNDTYSHSGGDDCLKEIAKVISPQVDKASALVARYGGEEFAVILPDTNATEAASIGESIRQAVYNLNIPHEQSSVAPYVTVSVGIATMIPSSQDSYHSLVERADRAMIEAKNRGKNQVVSAS